MAVQATVQTFVEKGGWNGVTHKSRGGGVGSGSFAASVSADLFKREPRGEVQSIEKGSGVTVRSMSNMRLPNRAVGGGHNSTGEPNRRWPYQTLLDEGTRGPGLPEERNPNWPYRPPLDERVRGANECRSHHRWLYQPSLDEGVRGLGLPDERKLKRHWL